ncbi:polynucleotide adenylyltransferase PcnB [Pseudoteredinibacter isoporae]|uniref:Poly(A) polymerase I n=1 Tax=Pseudoteredinibacter isoporae TaxID=570281 RepID=A0A7X0JVK9_9GAMM|nr:polynucleotide adenylyltransferase PcnB [Pseudoteredinibacter isoporae]MBB6522982.1 poly(A) polymerase [Pseudoteredinibacter isoporae]NHO88506.1 polynucleotide adenylyltransferase PcnB [Pseudoteredinibacter isoporae]NIB22095.1 polynucleotide adenylyltransferase PcnB [Pseudoteredinibacter isoporae]
MFTRVIRSINNLFKSPNHFEYPEEARVIPRDQHSISRKQISRSALKVMKILNEGGFEAYLVGGGVRDTLLGGNPKDFDVATDATPEQVRKLFRSARIIGRRFRIVHVRFGREIIEVTTFRANHDSAANSTESRQSKEGMLLRDNVFGDLRSDALRRDFTVNALYYSLDGFTLHDYTDGMSDLENRLIRMIGDPQTRYQEDPVRLLRAARFAAKLDFDIEPNTAAPIKELAPLLENISSARLFDECLKLFLGGYATATFKRLCEYELLTPLFPATAKRLQDGESIDQALLERVMQNTDRRLANEQRVTPAFILAALLWGPLQDALAQQDSKSPPAMRMHKASQQVIDAQLKHTAIPKRFLITMREIWDLQGRLPMRSGKRALRLMEHKRFRAAYDFLLLREAAGEDCQGLGCWWTEFQDATEERQTEMLEALPKPKRPRRRRRKPSGNSDKPAS